jgi:cytochrome c-type biogenesis protein CcmH/NrfG
VWFYPILLILVLLGIAGGVFLGGVYTLVLVPLVVIVLVSALGYALWARSQAVASGSTATPDPSGHPPLPHRRQRMASRAQTTPERLVEGRRQQQQVPE